MIKDAEHAAAALYDGGWRTEDQEELQRHYGLTDEETAALLEKLEEMEAKKLATKIEILESFERRIKEIRHYHNRLRDFLPGDDDGAATYGVVLRSQIQDLLQILDDAERCM